MLLGMGCCRGDSTTPGAGWEMGLGVGGFALPAACSYPKSPVCCPLRRETAVRGWHWAKRKGQGREGARCPVGINPAALSEIAWVNKHESRWETRGSGQGQHSLSLLCESHGGRKGKRGGPGAAYPKEDLAGRSGVRVEAVLPSPRAKARPVPRDWGGWRGRDEAALLGGLWVVAKPQRCPFALCPELFRQRCCPGWSLPWSLGSS